MGASFRELVVWQRSIQLTAAIYQLTKAFPRSEQFGLTNQIRRAAVSIASNIAEGYGKSTKGEYVHFLGHARGSLCELQTQLVIAETIGIATRDELGPAETLASDVSRLLNSLMSKLKSC